MLRKVEFIGSGYEVVKFVMVGTDTMAEAIEAAKKWYEETGQDFHYCEMEIPKEYAYNESAAGGLSSGGQPVISEGQNRQSFATIAERLQTAVALEYKGILFDNWSIDEETQGVWVEMCQCCADKHMDLLSDELSLGGVGACGVKGCDVVGMDSDYERHYYVDFKLELIQALDAAKFMERYPELSDLDLKLFDAKMRLSEEAAQDGPNRSVLISRAEKPHDLGF